MPSSGDRLHANRVVLIASADSAPEVHVRTPLVINARLHAMTLARLLDTSSELVPAAHMVTVITEVQSVTNRSLHLLYFYSHLP